MLNTYQLTNDADDDLNDIFNYTEIEFGFNQAVKYLNRFDELFNSLCNNPNLGKLRPELGKDLYCLPEQNHLIFYTFTKNDIIISRVLHASRDLQQFL